MVEGRIPQFNLEPESQKGQNPLSPADRLVFERQANPSIDEARFLFVTMVIDREVHLIRRPGISKKVFNRQFDIVKRCILERKSKESVGQEYGGRHINWVNRELREGLINLWNNSPEAVRREFPRESIFVPSYKNTREKRMEREHDLVSKLSDPNLSKEQLKELLPRFNRSVYERNRHLFYRLERLMQEAGHPLIPSIEPSLIARKLEQECGIVVFSFSTREKGEVKNSFLVLKHDRDDALEDLSKLTQRPSGRIIYRSF